MERTIRGGLRRHLSYANVVATLALFLVVAGGFAAAAALKRNSVKSKQIAANAVKTAELATGAATTPKLADNAATGPKVDEDTLAKVPSAAAADTIGGKTPAELQTSSAFGSSSATGGVGTSFQTLATATITTQSAGRILASGSAELLGDNGGDTGECNIRIDGDASLNYRTQADDSAPFPNEFVIAVNHAVTRPAGTYVVDLRCRAVGLVDVLDMGKAAINVYGLGS